MTTRAVRLAALATAAAVIQIAAAASAQTRASAAEPGYPTKPIRVVHPFPPGGGTDAMARILQPKLSEALGQPLVMDHRPGAAGSIAAEIVAKSTPDGYTLLMGFSTVLTTNPSLYTKLAFDPLRDFAPITHLATSQYLLIVHPSVPANSVGQSESRGALSPVVSAAKVGSR